MRYIISLMKKDLLVNKKIALISFLVAIVMPVFLQYKIDRYGLDGLPFCVTEFLILYILFGNSSMLDYKYKGASLLSTTPYKRKTIVVASYLFLLACFLVCLLIYEIVGLVPASELPKLSINALTKILLGNTLFYGITIPLQYRFGYEKMKFITYGVVFLVPFCLPTIANYLAKNSIDVSKWIQITETVQTLILLGIIIIIGYVSIFISIRTYAKKDLQ